MVDKKRTAIYERLMSGASLSMIKDEFGDEGVKVAKELTEEIEILSLEDATKLGIERLSFLANKLMDTAEKGDDTAIKGITNIIQVQQKMNIAYKEMTPDEDSQLNEFRDKLEKKSKKNSRKF